MALLVYVDDILIGGSSVALVDQLVQFLTSRFKLRSMGEPKYFLGIEVARSAQGFSLC